MAVKDAKQTEEMTQKWSKILLRAWADEVFKERLLANPDLVLKEHGISREKIKFNILADEENLTHLTLLTKPVGDSGDCCDSCSHFHRLKK